MPGIEEKQFWLKELLVVLLVKFDDDEKLPEKKKLNMVALFATQLATMNHTPATDLPALPELKKWNRYKSFLKNAMMTITNKMMAHRPHNKSKSSVYQGLADDGCPWVVKAVLALSEQEEKLPKKFRKRVLKASVTLRLLSTGSYTVENLEKSDIAFRRRLNL